MLTELASQSSPTTTMANKTLAHHDPARSMPRKGWSVPDGAFPSLFGPRLLPPVTPCLTNTLLRSRITLAKNCAMFMSSRPKAKCSAPRSSCAIEASDVTKAEIDHARHFEQGQAERKA